MGNPSGSKGGFFATDFNTIKSPGIYRVADDATNQAPGLSGGVLLVFEAIANNVFVQVQKCSSGMKSRMFWYSGFDNWV